MWEQIVTPGYLLALLIGFGFLGIGVYSWRSPEMSFFRGANVIDGDVGGREPGPAERFIAKTAGLVLILLGLGWLVVMAWPHWL